MVIGLTGPNAAGKGEVARHLGRLGFALHSLSDIVREEATRRGRAHDRVSLILTGNELRREGGPAILAERIVTRLGARDVVDSIRNPSEVEALRGLAHFTLVGVVAEARTRFRRARERRRGGDPETFEEFELREREENTSDPHAQQLEATLRLADFTVRNDEDLAALHAAIEDLTRRLAS